jgi:hypothetical protein
MKPPSIDMEQMNALQASFTLWFRLNKLNGTTNKYMLHVHSGNSSLLNGRSFVMQYAL